MYHISRICGHFRGIFRTCQKFMIELFRKKMLAANYFSKENIEHCVKSPYLELFWSAFSSIRTEYGEIRSISPNSVQMRENADQNNSEYGHFSRSGLFCAGYSSLHNFHLILFIIDTQHNDVAIRKGVPRN